MSDAAPCRLLEWDSGFFGAPVARVVGDRLDEARVAAVLAWCEAHGVSRVECLASPDPVTVAAAERGGFHLVDVRMELTRAAAVEALAPVTQVRRAESRDLPALEAAAARLHGDSRYYADPCISRERADELFRTWIRNSCHGWADAVFVVDAGAGAAALGYVTLHREPAASRVRIGLLGVVEDARGQGHGRRLVEAAAVEAHRRGAVQVSVVTQGRNLAALRLYEGAGFRTSAFGLWYHRSFTGQGR